MAKIHIKSPNDIAPAIIDKIIDLIISGGQIKDKDGLKGRLLKAHLIAYKIEDDKIITTATLKNQSPSYVKRKFTEACVVINYDNYKELGYIVTHPMYEGQGHCGVLLNEFFNEINSFILYATTRKPAMIHILTKLGFKTIGKTFRTDLRLLVFHGSKN